MNDHPTTYAYAVALGSTFVLSIILIPLCRVMALKLDIVDKPGGRKEHQSVTPLLGGLAMYLASMAVVFLMTFFFEFTSVRTDQLFELHFLFLGGTVIFLTGLLDDVIKRKKELAYYYKLLGQVIAIALAMLIMGKDQFHNIIGGKGHMKDYAYLVFFLLWILTTINSFNCGGSAVRA